MTKLSKKQRLEDAAAHLFWTKGYMATSIADLAKEANVPLGNVYYYYKTKSELAIAVANMFVVGTKNALDGLETIIPQSPTAPQQRIKAFFAMLEQSHMSRAKSGCPIARAIADFKANVPEAAHKANQALTLLISFLGRELARAGHPNSMSAAQSTIALWQGAIILAYSTQNPQILNQLCDKEYQRLMQALPKANV